MLAAAYATAEERYKASNPLSLSAHARARPHLPGGNTRSVLHWKPYPLCIARADGFRVVDVDGHAYVDLLGEYSAGVYGHSHPVLRDEVNRVLDNGWGYGGVSEAEERLGRLLAGRFGWDNGKDGDNKGGGWKVRFTNSGTEANLLAIAAAKAFTGKYSGKVLVFEGGYHGGVLVFPAGCRGVWMRDDDTEGEGKEEAEGRGKGKFEALRALNAPHGFLIATYNDVESVDAAIASSRKKKKKTGGKEEEEEGEEEEQGIAAILLEPMLGSGGGVCATSSFLAHLRRRATEIGALLIFDEVMTSRMHSGGGLQNAPEMLQGARIKPDITTLGKYIGGGFSFGAFGGRADVMSVFDPTREESEEDEDGRGGGGLGGLPLPHAGTFNNNVFSMNVGARGLEDVFTREKALELHAFGDEVRARLNGLGERENSGDSGRGRGRGRKLRVLGCGSILVIHFTAAEIKDISSPADWKRDEDQRLLDLFHLEMLHEGFYLARRGYIALNIVLLEEEGRKEMDRFVSAVEGFLNRFGGLL
ncbi:class III aminotransferase [Xylariaceae sp. FL0594]|nr:class III aminotransferase [Xylariaceae sp. FL0594]